MRLHSTLTISANLSQSLPRHTARFKPAQVADLIMVIRNAATDLPLKN